MIEALFGTTLGNVCTLTMKSLFARLLALGATCLTSASYADLRNDLQTEEVECHPMTAANEALVKMTAFQVTWEWVIDRDPRIVRHGDVVFDNGIRYERTAPYSPWRATPYAIVVNPNPDGTPRHSDCHRLREEVLDGVNTVVISYTQTVTNYTDYDEVSRCNVWLEIPEYRNRKMTCTRINSSGVVELKMRWFYRSDIKPPLPR